MSTAQQLLRESLERERQIQAALEAEIAGQGARARRRVEQLHIGPAEEADEEYSALGFADPEDYQAFLRADQAGLIRGAAL